MEIEDILAGKTAVYHTLGCKLNFAETSSLENLLEKSGVGKAKKGVGADICIVNTCSVTDVADHKCRQVIHKLVRENPSACVIVMGCYAQLQPDKVAHIEGVDLVLGMEHKGELVDRLKQILIRREIEGNCSSLHEAVAGSTRDIRTFVPSCSCGNRTRYFLKVQDGCDYYCTYCTIPFARGRSRNPWIKDLVAQARGVAEAGGKEIVITGVNIGDFGKTTGETFFDLIKALDAVDGIERYRISSIEPNLLTDEILEFCAGSRSFMPHFHIPLQAGSDEVLRLMHRHYDTSFFATKIARVKQLIPDAFIGVDVIVGTRGETEELFEKAITFCSSLDVSQYHVFSYSERPGTRALKITDYIATPEEKHARSHRMIALSEQKRKDFYRHYQGTVRPVLLEHPKEGMPMHGFTDNYIKVELKTTPSNEALDNHVVRVKLGEMNADDTALQAEIV